MAGRQGRWVKLRGYVCVVCGRRMWATERPRMCTRCKSNVIRKTKEYRLSCDERACKHNSEGRYCKLKEPRIEGGECLSFEPREKK